MADGIEIRVEGTAGRATLRRPEALNALTAPMIPALSAALDAWEKDDAVGRVILDAEGGKAFCAGGDIADLHAAGRRGDYGFGRRFWEAEYRLNARLAEFPKPTFSFLQGYTMGGGVGLGCHCAHRIVGDSSRIAMPECGIGLVPDVGGSLILARAPGRLGEYLALTGARMGPGDAIHAGFADHYLPEAEWEPLKARLVRGDEAVPAAPPPAPGFPAGIDDAFSADTLPELVAWLEAREDAFAARALDAIRRNSPLSMAASLLLVRRVRERPSIRAALTEEYRFTWRASEEGDFLEGIRASIIDRDRRPEWRHGLRGVDEAEAEAMLAPLGEHDLAWEGQS